jgi:hypothetical protein
LGLAIARLPLDGTWLEAVVTRLTLAMLALAFLIMVKAAHKEAPSQMSS